MKLFNLHIAAVITFAAAGLAACEPRAWRHGQIFDHEAVESIEPGVHNQLEVKRSLGTPSSSSLFGDETWFYISQYRTASVLSMPQTESQIVVAVAFDDAGIVQEIAMLTIEDGLIVNPVSRKTPTHGRELGLLEQLIGNIGRFDSTARTASPTP